MVLCYKCNVEIPYLPFRCKYCGKYFCRDHRLPENHGCSGRFNAPIVVVPANIQKEMGIKIEEQPQKHPRKRLYQDFDETGRSLRRRDTWFSSSRWRRIQESKFGRNIVTNVFLILLIAGFILVNTPVAWYVVLSPPYFFLEYYVYTIFTAVFVPAIGLNLFAIMSLGFMLFMCYTFGKRMESTIGRKFVIKFILICGLLTGAIFVLAVFLFSLIPGYGGILYYPVGFGTTFGIIIGEIVFIAFMRPDITVGLYFLPFKFKPKTIAIIFIAFGIGWGFLLWGSLGFVPTGSVYLCNGLQDLGGALGGYLIAKYGRARLPSRPPPMQFISQY